MKPWTVPNENTAPALADAFRRAMRHRLTPGQLTLVDRRNAARGDKLSCATHDFCDANMVMFAAFTDVMKREPDVGDQADADVINAAWDIAIARGFAETKRRG